MARTMRVLSIDGGGIRGLIPASVLVEVEAMLQAERGPDCRLADHFDLFAGTSTGGLIAGLLLVPEGAGASGRPPSRRPALRAQDVVDFYLKHASTLFRRSRWQFLRRFGGLTDERYGTEGMETALAEVLGPRRGLEGGLLLSQLLRPTLITTYNASTSRPYFFKQHRAAQPDGRDFALHDVGRATAAAPTYFEPVRVDSTQGELGVCIDGGVFANNPALCAYAEATKAFGHRAADMAILSLGTGTSPPTYAPEKMKDWGAISWIKPMIDIMMVGSDRTVDHNLRQIFGTVGPEAAAEQYLRLQADLGPEPPPISRMDSAEPESLDRLVAIGKEIVEEHRDRLLRFLHDEVLAADEGEA